MSDRPGGSDPEPFDTRFSLPAVDDPASTEIGVILMGLDAERLLAGLGIATFGEDAALVTMLVDQARHGGPVDFALSSVVSAGAGRWRRARTALSASDPGKFSSASLRRAWTQALSTVADADLAEMGPASRAYLTACWLRRSEVDGYLEDHPDAVPQVTA